MKSQKSFIELRIKTADDLLTEIHNYIKWQAPLDIKNMSRDEIFKVSYEAMRITIRVTQIIGWFMLQKAVLEGELSKEDIISEHITVFQGKHCLESLSETDLQLPHRLRELLKKSRNLYLQTMRLEAISLRTPPLPEQIKKERQKCFIRSKMKIGE